LRGIIIALLVILYTLPTALAQNETDCNITCTECEELDPTNCVCNPITPCCGNTECEAGENSTTCPEDCPVAVCGDGVCDPGETCCLDCEPPIVGGYIGPWKCIDAHTRERTTVYIEYICNEEYYEWEVLKNETTEKEECPSDKICYEGICLFPSEIPAPTYSPSPNITAPIKKAMPMPPAPEVTPLPTKIPPEILKECIKNITKEDLGITEEKAEKLCYNKFIKTLPPMPIDKECYEKALKEGMIEEEAKGLCTIYGKVAIQIEKAVPVVPPSPKPIEKKEHCEALEDKLLALSDRVLSASPKERASLQKDIETIRKELKKCAVGFKTIKTPKAVITIPVPTLSLPDLCEEVDRLEKVRETLISQVEEFKEKGEEAKALKILEKIEHLEEELERIKEACERKEIDSLEDVEAIYLEKLQISIEKAENYDELIEELAQIEEEKRKMIEEFTRKIQELELKKARIIKKLKIKGGEVTLDDVKVTVPKIKIEVEDTDIELIPKKEEVELIEGNITVKGKAALEYSEGVLRAAGSGKPIKVLPSELKDIVKGEVSKVELVDEDVPKYIVKVKEKGKLLGMIPVTVAKESHVNAEEGKIISEKKPWWSFLVF
jgi:hypothetical protein